MPNKDVDYGKLLHVVCHKINKVQNSKEVSHKFGDRLSQAEEPSTLNFFNSFMKERTSSNRETSYSAFIEGRDGDAAVFQKHLLAYLEERQSNQSFMAFSKKIAEHFEACLSKVIQAIGGILFTLDYEKDNHHCIVVTLLNEEISSSLKDDLTLLSGKALNIKQVAFSAIIDCTNWRSEDLRKERPNYITLASGQRNMPDYYKDSFLGCMKVVNGEESTKTFMKSIESFCAQKKYSNDKIDKIYEKVANYCEVNKKEAFLPDILNHIFPETKDQEEYYKHCQENNFEVSSSFKPHRKALNRWLKFTYNKNGIDLKISRDRINDQTAFYREKEKVLVIKDSDGELWSHFKDFSRNE